MAALLQHLLIMYGYWLIAAVVLIESAGIPLPGETILLLGAAYAGTGHLQLWGVIVAAAVGGIAGATLGYELGRRGGRTVIEHYGHWLHIDQQQLQRAEAFFVRYGDKAVFFARFIAILRSFSPFLAGLNHMSYRRFMIFNAAGGIIWAITFGLLGAAFGSQWPLVAHWLHHAGVLMFMVALLGVAGGIFWYRSRNTIQPVSLQHKAKQLFAPPQRYLLGVLVGIIGIGLFGKLAEDMLRQERLVQLDQAVNQFLVAHNQPHVAVAMALISLVGSPLVILAFTALLAGVFALRKAWATCMLLLAAAIGAEGGDALLKLLFARPRPSLPGSVLWVDTYSFPSGHAMGSIAFYGIIVYLIVSRNHSWLIRVGAVLAGSLLVLLIGFSRLYLGVHYMSDVMAGYVAGLTWLAIVVTAYTVYMQRRVAQASGQVRFVRGKQL